ncbi:hypothetical protein K7432_000408 [Basidiobolus ranarum]|uniref:Uncharacterized protein n=1 Tax=Basidiobolus ranarum TaxID=34480 RepID=A0ABR2X4R9_9FUNG
MIYASSKLFVFFLINPFVATLAATVIQDNVSPPNVVSFENEIPAVKETHNYLGGRFRQRGRDIIAQELDGGSRVQELLHNVRPLSKNYLRAPDTYFKRPRIFNVDKNGEDSLKDNLLLSKSKVVRERSSSAKNGKSLKKHSRNDLKQPHGATTTSWARLLTAKMATVMKNKGISKSAFHDFVEQAILEVLRENEEITSKNLSTELNDRSKDIIASNEDNFEEN